ncbi:MAG TPA: hypothetical protein VET66_02355 [Steroidobacteraceae bacterium]|nr:hypothetical protein [Steroidobacteraceae bacterium]
MRLIIIGGGCYGCYHTRQLLKAQRRGAIAADALVVVDRNPACRALTEFAGEPLVRVVRADWASFLYDELGECSPETDDRLVPAPFAPHLLCDWLLAVARKAAPERTVERVACALALGLPFERGDGATGNRFISAAGWVCPATCIETALCPAIRGPRTWELGDLVRAGAARAPMPYQHVALFTCRHFAFGIGTIPVAEMARARLELTRALREDGSPQRALVGTISSCHGVLGELVAHAPSRNSAIIGA